VQVREREQKRERERAEERARASCVCQRVCVCERVCCMLHTHTNTHPHPQIHRARERQRERERQSGTTDREKVRERAYVCARSCISYVVLAVYCSVLQCIAVCGWMLLYPYLCPYCGVQHVLVSWRLKMTMWSKTKLKRNRTKQNAPFLGVAKRAGPFLDKMKVIKPKVGLGTRGRGGTCAGIFQWHGLREPKHTCCHKCYSLRHNM